MFVLCLLPIGILAAETRPVVKETDSSSVKLAENAKSAIMLEASSGKILFEKIFL